MNQTMEFEIPSTVRDLASKSVDQAREAYNRFLEAARQAHDVVMKSSDVITSGAREINQKAVKYTEANLQANFELAQRLVHAKDIKEALDIQKSVCASANGEFRAAGSGTHPPRCAISAEGCSDNPILRIYRRPAGRRASAGLVSIGSAVQNALLRLA